jgi:hypothetical protein
MDLFDGGAVQKNARTERQSLGGFDLWVSGRNLVSRGIF